MKNIMEKVNTLKDLAISNSGPSTLAPNSLNETETNDTNNVENDDLHINDNESSDTPVILADNYNRNPGIGNNVPNSIDSVIKANELASKLMNTPTPSMVGLDDDTLTSGPIPAQSIGSAEYAFSPKDDMLVKEIMPDISDEKRLELAKPLIESRGSIVKDLILNMGFTPDEANIAADNQIKKKLTEIYETEKKEEHVKKPLNPEEVATIQIDKSSDPNELGLTKEEHEKLEKVKKVRLVLVDDVELANIQIERPNEEHKVDYVKSIEGSLSKYSVPLPMLGDFVGFKGAQMLQMVNVVHYEDATLDEIVNTKASLIYDKLVDGATMKKYDNNGKVILSYNEFVNKYPYHDIDLGLFGILCASSMEENTTSVSCPKCKHEYMQKYNLKSLLKLDGVSDLFKKRIDDILKYKNDPDKLRELYEEKRKARRYKSPFTGNIYDLSYPSVARAISLFKKMKNTDDYIAYIGGIAMYISRILVYNPTKNTYVEITADESDVILDVLKAISNDDINMLGTQVYEDLIYSPKFSLKIKCPSCGHETDVEISIEELIFLVAQDSMVEIGI